MGKLEVLFSYDYLWVKPPKGFGFCPFKVVVLLLLIRYGLLLPLWDSVIVLGFGVRHFMSILVFNHLDGDDKTGYFALFVLLVSPDCCVALPKIVKGLSAVCDCGIILT